MKKKKIATAWAWKIKEGLCFWSLPTKKRLIDEGKPSPEAKAVRVVIVEASEYKRLTIGDHE